EKIKRAIAEQNFEGHDDFGIPILKYDACLEAHVQVGLGPLHSVFDDKGNGYTSCFLDSTVVKWTLGPPYNPPEKARQAVDKVSIHYNIGHLRHPAPPPASPGASIGAPSTSGPSTATRRSGRPPPRTSRSSTSAAPRWRFSPTRRRS